MKHDVSTIKVSLRNNILIAISKLVAFSYTGSISLLAEFWHSVADSGNQGLLWWGASQSNRKADKDHPFGHGKRIYFWSFVVACILFIGGGWIPIREGLEKIHHPEPLHNIGVGTICLLVALVLEGQSWYKAWVDLDRPSFKEMFKELVDAKDADTLVIFVEDSGAIIGLFLAFMGTMLSLITGNPIYDAISSVLIGVLLWVFALFLGHQTCELLIGEAIDEVEVRYVRRILNGDHDIKKVGEIKTMQLGNSCIITARVDFVDDLHDFDIEYIIAGLIKRIEATIPESKGNIFIQPTKL